MLTNLRSLVAAPVFAEEDKTRKARYANAIAIAFLLITIAYEIAIRTFMSYNEFSIIDLMILSLTVTCIVALVMLRRGYVYAASVILVVLIWGVTNSIAATGYGAQDSSFLTNFTIVLVAGLLLNWQASLLLTVLSILSGFGLAYAERYGIISHNAYPITSFAFDIATVFVFNATIIYLLINGLENALRNSRASLEKLETTNTDLSKTQQELQGLATELMLTNKQLETRTEKLRVIAAITSTAASIHDFEQLINSISSIIAQQLGYYHVAVFLLDEQKQHAIMRSTNSESGLNMMARDYRLQVGQRGAVSTVAQTGKPQIETGMAGFITKRELPETRSELALPLKSGDQIIGVLDLHSTQADAFHDEEISSLSILADQVGIALQNALIYEQSQRALREANAAFQKTSKTEWKGYGDAVQTKGYRYDGIKPEPLKESRQSPAGENTVSIPVQLRGLTIGQLRLKPSDPAKQWTEDEIAMAEATAERAALAMEGARLLEEAQKRASREAFLSDVASKLGTSFQLDSILRDTVEELGQTLKGSIVSFQLIRPSTPENTESSAHRKQSE